MSHNLGDIVRSWADVVEGKRKYPLNDTWHNIKVRGQEIYSYGTHFELARPLRNRKGKVEAYLLNGDRVSVSTDRHQAEVRAELSRRGATTVIIPHEALASAGIDLDSVRILETQEERWEPIEHTSRNFDDVPVHYQHYAETHTEQPSGYGGRWGAWQDADGVYHWLTTRHWLGGSLIRAKVTWFERVECPHCHGDPMEGPAYLNRYGGLYAAKCPTCHGDFRITIEKHRWATFLSSFDEQETRPSYFFCELPARSKARTIAEAYEALKPDTVRLAEQMGRSVTRQGDIFAVATSYTKAQLRKMGATFERTGYMLGTNHMATEVARLGRLTLARGILHHSPAGRRPDHKRQPLGDRKGWHIIEKNTVPVAA